MIFRFDEHCIDMRNEFGQFFGLRGGMDKDRIQIDSFRSPTPSNRNSRRQRQVRSSERTGSYDINVQNRSRSPERSSSEESSDWVIEDVNNDESEQIPFDYESVKFIVQNDIIHDETEEFIDCLDEKIMFEGDEIDIVRALGKVSESCFAWAKFVRESENFVQDGIRVN